MVLCLYLVIVCIEGNFRRFLLCMNMLTLIRDMYMMNLHIVDAICDCCHLGICVGLHY